jgi:hypothetical protein
MWHGDEFEFRREETMNPEQEQGTESRQKRDHAHDGMIVSRKTAYSLGFWEFRS